jgi:uncharacterized protein (DUF2336 family)
MMGLLQRMLRTGRPGAETIGYEESKRLLQSPEADARRRLASREEVRPEVLYYLAGDKDAGVRAAVAANEATPVQADLMLARDSDEEVRVELAQKIARLTPGLSEEQHQRLREITYDVLRILVRDQVTRVRQMLADVLKDVANVPPDVIRALARDSEIVVAGPVLQFSPVLTDDDLLEIIRSVPVPGALAAIARRSHVHAEVADALSAAPDVVAITTLLENKSAQIREETLDCLIDRAADVVEWHSPLVRRPLLPAKAASRLARFVARELLELLSARRDLNPESAREVNAVMMRRLAADEKVEQTRAAAPRAKPATPKTQLSEALSRARALKAKGELGEPDLLSALGSDRAFARAALAVLSDAPVEVVDRVLAAHSAKGVTALAWKSGLSMRAAVKVQMLLGQIPPSQALRPRNGDAYPMSEEAMRWQLEFFGVAMAAEPAQG